MLCSSGAGLGPSWPPHPGSAPLTGGPGGWLASARHCRDGAGSAPATAKGESSVSCSPVPELWGAGCRDVPHTGDQVGKLRQGAGLGCRSARGAHPSADVSLQARGVRFARHHRRHPPLPHHLLPSSSGRWRPASPAPGGQASGDGGCAICIPKMLDSLCLGQGDPHLTPLP